MSAVPTEPAGRPTPFDRSSLIFWLVPLLTAYGVFIIGQQIVEGLQATAAGTLLSLALFGALGVVGLYLIVRLQLFDRKPAISIAAAFSWGAIVATGAGIAANASAQELITRIGGPLLTESWGPALVAPIDEESLKVLGVLALVLLPLGGVRSTFDGLIYGMMVGLGFQITEDVLYGMNAAIAGEPSSVFGSFVSRGLVSGLFSHAVYTGITGAGIGFAASRTDLPWSRRIGVAVLLFLAAVHFHFLWDSPLIVQQLGGPVGAFVGIFVKGIPTLILLLVLIRWARRQERQEFETLSKTHVDEALISDAEREHLGSRRARKQAIKSNRKQHGRKAVKPTRQMHAAQLDLVQRVSEDGPDSPAAARAATEVHGAKRRLDVVATGAVS